MRTAVQRGLDIAAGIGTGVVLMFALITWFDAQPVVSTLLALVGALGLSHYVSYTRLKELIPGKNEVVMPYTQPRAATRMFFGQSEPETYDEVRS